LREKKEQTHSGSHPVEIEQDTLRRNFFKRTIIYNWKPSIAQHPTGLQISQ